MLVWSKPVWSVADDPIGEFVAPQSLVFESLVFRVVSVDDDETGGELE
jgi:hypothetical protein